MSAQAAPRQRARRRVLFHLNAPKAEEVILGGTLDRSWDTRSRYLKRDKRGIWKTCLWLEPGTYEFRFLVDGQWQYDPGSEVVPHPCGKQNRVQVAT